MANDPMQDLERRFLKKQPTDEKPNRKEFRGSLDHKMKKAKTKRTTSFYSKLLKSKTK